MDPRRPPRAVSDPKVRQVGFFASPDPIASSSPPVSNSPSGNSLSPVMIPPPRHSSDTSRPVLFPTVPASPARRESVLVESYNNSSELFPASPPTASSSYGIVMGNGEFLNDVVMSPGRTFRRVRAAGGLTTSSSFPSGGFDLTAAVKASSVPASGLMTVSVVKMPSGISEKDVDASTEVQSERAGNSKPLKEKTTKAERRALQEAQRAAKAAAKADGGKTPSVVASASAAANVKPPKATKLVSQSSVAVSEKKGGGGGGGNERPPEKERKKEVPHPRMQYDDKSRVEKAKRRSVVKQTEARNRVELFRHLPQYEHGTQLPDLESKFFQLDPVHPAVYKVGLQYLSGDISGGNARCIAMLLALQEAIKDYSTPPEKTLSRDLTAKISSYVSFFSECRPLSITMGNAIRFLKSRIAKLPLSMSESEAKASLQLDIDRFIAEKIILADNVIVKHAVSKIRDGDVLLTYGSSSAVEMLLLHAHELGKQFRVVVVDARPKLEGQRLLRRLVGKGLSCTYTHINAASYIMHEVTRVFLGASSVLSNGTVYSRVGTACVAMVAHAFRVPVLVCCEAYKFHERVQLDSICSNELGDPDVILKVPGREVNPLDGTANCENLQPLNLMYVRFTDALPSDYISMIITDYGMVPPTSVPVIVREYGKEHLWM
ncbi:LOW QUALITY PROTEIN: translation initiation factor eIF-2B subunit delta [Pyrus x bretschneideri]|uniref:LOW QUALITY PROTEIN: translation initiation factor eIF-2B subunit delta n=1 Tax=Pyrus x bretschneideri TaxID=225117 RepID=UPI00202EA630|nr:LOW QUALITY PROTEIN: translation initiation factor eIF-2B subunit delta [Pyrus x bretschneideri]